MASRTVRSIGCGSAARGRVVYLVHWACVEEALGPRFRRTTRLEWSTDKRCLCGRDCRALALPGPLSATASRRRISREAMAGRRPASSTRAHGRAPGEPRSLLAKSRGQDARVTADARVSFSWLLLFGQAKRSNRRPWMADEAHKEVSRFSRQRREKTKTPERAERRINLPSPYPLPQAGEGKQPQAGEGKQPQAGEGKQPRAGEGNNRKRERGRQGARARSATATHKKERAKKSRRPKGRRPKTKHFNSEATNPYWQTSTLKLSMMSPFGAFAAVFESLVMR